MVARSTARVNQRIDYGLTLKKESGAKSRESNGGIRYSP